MCIVCILWDQDKLTIDEAKQALFEIAEPGRDDMGHFIEVYQKLIDEERRA